MSEELRPEEQIVEPQEEITQEAEVEAPMEAEPEKVEEVPTEEEPKVEEPETEEEERKVEKTPEEPEAEPEVEKEEENKPKEETPQEEEKVEEPKVEEPVEDVEAIKKELAELKAIQQEEKEIKDFSTKRDVAINQYNEMCGRLANALAGEFEKYGIDTTKSIDEIAKEDPAKAEIAKGLITQAERIQNEQKAKVNDELNAAFTDIVFTRAARLMEKFELTEQQQEVVAETFIAIMENSGIKDLAEDLMAKVELAVAKAKMVAPKVVEAVKETKEAVEAVKEVVEAIKEEPKVEVEEQVPEVVIPEPVVEPVAEEDFKEGAVQNAEVTPAAALDETNVLQKLASLPHKERVAFYKENYDLITRASQIASAEHARRMTNGEV
ncbi:MAG: hypothetical protein NC218_08390 [Acetobacter sp.]|nr:hypothetical protein [Acetobacter sp.]